WANHIGEFAFGINNKARIHDEFVETEKIKTVHIAVGNNLSFPGGCKNASANHLDFLVKNPSVEVTYADGKRLQIMKSGEYLV
ncbi:MAG: leucyl aminopeptidase, partial [Promethearchaeota archaeon]